MEDWMYLIGECGLCVVVVLYETSDDFIGSSSACTNGDTYHQDR